MPFSRIDTVRWVPHKCLTSTRTNVDPQQQQATSGNTISANTRIYSTRRVRGTFQNRAGTYN